MIDCVAEQLCALLPCFEWAPCRDPGWFVGQGEQVTATVQYTPRTGYYCWSVEETGRLQTIEPFLLFRLRRALNEELRA